MFGLRKKNKMASTSRATKFIENFLVPILAETNLAYSVLNVPENALSFEYFDQTLLIRNLNSIGVSETLDPRGFCYGYHTLSLAYSALGLETRFTEIFQGLIQAKTLSTTQKEFVNSLKECQDTSTAADFETGVMIDAAVVILKGSIQKKISLPNDEYFLPELKKVVESAIVMAATYFGGKIALLILGEELSHLISLQAKCENGKFILQYDDSNYFLNVKYQHCDDARKDLVHLLQHGYKSFYASLWQKKKEAGIYLGSFEAECYGDCSRKAAVDASWVRDNRARFFAASQWMAEEKESIFDREETFRRDQDGDAETQVRRISRAH